MPLKNCKSQACTCEVFGKFRWCLSARWFKFSIATEFAFFVVIKVPTLIIFFFFFFSVRLYPEESRYSMKCLHVVSYLKCRAEECFWVFFKVCICQFLQWGRMQHYMAVLGVIPLETKAWWVCFTKWSLPCSAPYWAFCFNFSLLWLVPNHYRQFLCQEKCPILIQSSTITLSKSFFSGALKFCCIHFEHLVWCSFLHKSPMFLNSVKFGGQNLSP